MYTNVLKFKTMLSKTIFTKLMYKLILLLFESDYVLVFVIETIKKMAKSFYTIFTRKYHFVSAILNIPYSIVYIHFSQYILYFIFVICIIIIYNKKGKIFI